MATNPVAVKKLRRRSKKYEARSKNYSYYLLLATYYFLVVRLSATGDVVHALPALMELRAAYPDGQIDWLAEPASAPMLRHSGAVDQVIEVATGRWRRRPFSPATWKELATTVRLLRGRRYDVALDLQGLWKSAFPARISGAREVAGMATADLREPSARIMYDRQAEPAGRMHQVERNRKLLSLLGVTSTGPARYPERLWSPADQARADAIRSALPEKFVVLHPGAGWATKVWAPER